MSNPIFEHFRMLSQMYDGKNNITKEIVEFTQEKSEPINQIQKDLIDYTNSNFKNNFMITDIGQNQLFTLLLKVLNAKKVIDVGVYTGLSSLSFALSIPDDGKVIGLDISNDYVEVATKHWKLANVDKKIQLKIQDATKSLNELIENGESGTYDFIFIDADKVSYDSYYELSLKLIRPGGIIAIDNVLFWGATTIDPNNAKPEHQHFFANEEVNEMINALVKLNDKISNDTRVIKTMLPLSDGITLITKK
ncbi:hypothetical protein RB653_000644 [Dictyostelium firmibasis]|uniref:Caffeoyl-CoA O-methyltransferase n=1 Tax=Dictyostelium firmibasis TaxID=79012 RepID=A0AAN7TX19_9MYCE